MRRVIAILSISLTLQAPLAWSQNRIPINVVVEQLGKEPCGLTRDDLGGRAKLTLRQYGFTEAKKSTNPYLYISMNSLELGQQCVGHVAVEIVGYAEQDFGDGRMGWVSKATNRNTVLARTGQVLSYPRYEFPSVVLDSIEAHVKRVLGKIEY